MLSWGLREFFMLRLYLRHIIAYATCPIRYVSPHEAHELCARREICMSKMIHKVVHIDSLQHPSGPLPLASEWQPVPNCPVYVQGNAGPSVPASRLASCRETWQTLLPCITVMDVSNRGTVVDATSQFKSEIWDLPAHKLTVNPLLPSRWHASQAHRSGPELCMNLIH